MQNFRAMDTNLPLHEIMIIDDNNIDLIINSRVVQMLKVTEKITTKNSAVEALSDLMTRFENKAPMPELLLLDIMMPYMSGLEFLNEFSKIPTEAIQKVKIIMVSSSLDKNDYDSSMSYNNVSEFLNKPLTPQKLESAFLEIDIRR